MNSLDGIEIFVKVVQAGSFSAAARLLGMPVTTVSGKVAGVEKRLGMTLIHRTTRKLNLTQEGQAYFQHCVRALEEMSEAEKELSTKKTEPEGLLRITAPPDLGHLLLPSIVRNYLKMYPKTQVEMVLTNRVVDLIGEGVDLALRVGALKDSSLVARKFRDTHVSLWASDGYVKKHGMPLNPQDLTHHAFIAFKPHTSSIGLKKGNSALTVKVKPRIVVDDVETSKVFIASGDGIGVLPAIICENELAKGKLIEVLPGWKIDLGPGHMSFVYPPHRYVPPKIQAFIELAISRG